MTSQISSKSNEYSWNVPDWEREEIKHFWDPGRQLLSAIRGYQELNNTKRIHNILKIKWCVMMFRFWSVVAGADIPLNTNKIGGGLLLPHPNGIVIHPNVVIGPNCLIFQQVTLTDGVRIGYHVDIGAGAKVIRPVFIGNNVRIGANAVVTKDVPSGATVVGVPVRI